MYYSYNQVYINSELLSSSCEFSLIIIMTHSSLLSNLFLTLKLALSDIDTSTHTLFAQYLNGTFFLCFYFNFLNKFFSFLLEYSCFTILCQLLLYSKLNQLYLYIYPLFFGFPSHLSHYRALSRVPCAIQYVLISCLFYTWYQ